MTITFKFDNIDEALVAIEAVKKYQGAVEDFANDYTGPDAYDDSENDDETIDATAIQGIIEGLVDMDADELVEMFGAGNDKPYRVLKNFDYETIREELGDFAMPSVEVQASTEDVKAAVNIIIKDVGVGGLSHDQFEDLFGCRTSKKLFKNFKLDEIVRILKENNLI